MLTCPDREVCGVPLGAPHTESCLIAVCLATGGQRLAHLNGGEHDTGGYTCGADVWTGQVRGAAECAEYGWHVIATHPDDVAVLGAWTPCSPSTPGARPDLARLTTHARWSPAGRRWYAVPSAAEARS